MPPETDPLALVEDVTRFVAQLPDRAEKVWLLSCIRALRNGEDVAGAVGLPKTELSRLREARRNAWLRKAYELLDGVCGRNRCERLARESRRFESGNWQRWSQRDAAPDSASDLHVCLFHARCYGPLPAWRQLYRICVIQGDVDDTNLLE